MRLGKRPGKTIDRLTGRITMPQNARRPLLRVRKFLLLFAFVSLALLLAPVVRAQYALPPSRLSFPSPSPSPAPAPAETPAAPAPVQAAATPTPSATPKPKPAARPRNDVLNEKPVRAVEPHTRSQSESSPSPTPRRRSLFSRIPAGPATGPRASRPTFDFSESNWTAAAALRSAERKWEAAIKAHDHATVEKLLADEFRAVSTNGRGASRARLLQEIKNDKHVYQSAKVRGMQVRSHGPDEAVVTGTAIETGTTADGKRFTSTRRFSDTWRLRKGKWECVTSRSTKVAKKDDDHG